MAIMAQFSRKNDQRRAVALPPPLHLDLGLPKSNCTWLGAKAMYSLNLKDWLPHGKEGEGTQLAEFG